MNKQPLHPLFPSLVHKGSYRIREIARATGFSRQSLHKAIDRGDLQALKQGPRSYRIPTKSLLDYINSIYHDPFS